MYSVAVVADVYRAVADPTRRTMLDLLLLADRTATELNEPFQMTQPAISQHLKVLRDAGLVEVRREGRNHVYRLDRRPLQELCEWAGKYRDVVDPSGHVWRIRSAKEKR